MLVSIGKAFQASWSCDAHRASKLVTVVGDFVFAVSLWRGGTRSDSVNDWEAGKTYAVLAARMPW
jgi:hypothetical protein